MDKALPLNSSSSTSAENLDFTYNLNIRLISLCWVLILVYALAVILLELYQKWASTSNDVGGSSLPRYADEYPRRHRRERRVRKKRVLRSKIL